MLNWTDRQGAEDSSSQSLRHSVISVIRGWGAKLWPLMQLHSAGYVQLAWDVCERKLGMEVIY